MLLCAWILSCRCKTASTDRNGQQWILNKADKSEANNGVSFKEGSDNSTNNNNLYAVKIACFVQTEEGGGFFSAQLCGTEFWQNSEKNVIIYQIVLSSAQLPQSKKLILNSKRILLTWQQQRQSEIQLLMVQCSVEVLKLAEPPSQLNIRLNIHTHTGWSTN